MSRQRMIDMIVDAKQALHDTGLLSGKLTSEGGNVMDEGTKNLIGQLIMAVAIEESDSSTSLDRIANALNNVASRIREKR